MEMLDLHYVYGIFFLSFIRKALLPKFCDPEISNRKFIPIAKKPAVENLENFVFG